MFIKYYKYIVSKEWYELKIDIINSRGCKCERCNRKKPLQILQLHHLTYERLFKEEPQDLILICPKCHMKEHNLIKKNKKPKKRNFKYKITNKRDRRLQERYDKLKTG